MWTPFKLYKSQYKEKHPHDEYEEDVDFMSDDHLREFQSIEKQYSTQRNTQREKPSLESFSFYKTMFRTTKNILMKIHTVLIEVVK